MTQAQKLASNPAHSVYVGASAGSGKTKVLTDRVLRILLGGVPPGKIMCLTFTNAAAAEMANRINKNLMKWVAVSKAELIKDITDLTGVVPDEKTLTLARRLFVSVLDTPDGLKIQTIHSFCQNLMRRFPLEAGIAPHFQVIDEQTSLELLKESRMRLLSKKDEHSDVVSKAINNIAWRVDEGGFAQILHDITNEREKIEYLFSRYSMVEIVERICSVLNVKAEETEKSVIFDNYKDYDIEKIKDYAGILSAGGANDIKAGSCIKSFIDVFEKQGDIESAFNSYVLAFLTADFKPRKKLVNNNIAKKYPDCEQWMQKEQSDVLTLLDKVRSVRIAQLTIDLFHVSEAILILYKKAKNSKAFLDYNDLIIASNNLLNKSGIAPWILYKLDGGIDHLLVDEAQDTSPQQWKVIEALCGEFFVGQGASEKNRTVFIVGDEKQSIFSFQGADPKVFNQMQSVFSKRAKDAQKGWQTVALDRSFRSTSAVLKCVDAIFSKENIRKSVSFLPEYIPHVAHRESHAGLVELWSLLEKEEKDSLEPWTLPIKRIEATNIKRKLAAKIAATVKEWIDGGRKIEATGKTVSPGDIMILVRRRDALVDYLVSELKANDVAVAGVDRMILTEHIAVMDLMALGNFLLLPEDDLTLASVLKSPLIGMSEEELFEIAYKRGKRSLWSALKEKEGAVFQAAYEYLLGLLNKTDFVSPFEIYSHILEAKSGRKKLASRLGEEVNDPIDEFLSLALAYESSHPPALQGFLSWLSMGKTEVKRDLEQGNDEVRIMTVHGSKGLQAPIVFLPDTTSLPKNKSGNIFWTENNGEPIMLWSGLSENLNEYCNGLKDSAKSQTNDEYLRLLYVALTRAEDELYIAGYQDNKKITDECWYNVIKNGMEDIAENVDGKLVLRSEQLSEVVNDNEVQRVEEMAVLLPEFVGQKVPQEPMPSVPLTPSQLEGDVPVVNSPLVKGAILKGKLIHKLLQYLPELPVEKREEKALEFLNKYKNELSENEIENIKNRVFSVLNDSSISKIFGKGSKAEVPIVGMVGKFVISGRIDRLLVTDDEVLVIDYKTNNNVPANQEGVHKNYLKQMKSYKDALQEIYPDKKIRCALIWTSEAKVMWLDDYLLETVMF
ncbi:MAG: double-strand break repair helicase AddA [Alphaproteobacteria bacterium CG11_big_fil_rev_8_21_14_0_20_39_49]|nr:MAG: double-strand break repair helicase AddA [Alphaproteobacteria bacterium CG11_big_fil_rev_8_21_14_0_20_39_49]